MIEYIQLAGIMLILALILKPKKQRQSKRALVLDTSSIIDGRILAVLDANVTSDRIVVPDVVVNELQLLADGADSHKRERARYGFSVLDELQKSFGAKIEKATKTKGIPTDEMIYKFAKDRAYKLATNDYNLQKVAEAHGVSVFNVNNLSHGLKSLVLPGEKRQVKIIQKGSNPNQGIGYLEDGTMIVVDSSARLIGKKVDVIIGKSLQTVAGKMVFATLARKTDSDKNYRKPR